MGYTIPEYLATQQVEVSRVPRASEQIVSAGQGIVAEAIGAAAGQVGKAVGDLAEQKQAIRDSATLAQIQGELDDFEFNSGPDSSKIQTMEDFPKLQKRFEKDWDRKVALLTHGRSQAVRNQFKIYTDLHRIRARTAYRNKIRPMEKAYAEESIKKEWVNRLKVNVGNPVAQKKHLEALIENYSGYLDAPTKLTLNASIDKDVEGFNIQWLMNVNPETALEAIEKTTHHDEGEKNTLRSQARSHIGRRKRENKERLQQARENTMRSLLANWFDGTLKDPAIVTAFTRAGYLDVADAKFLHNAIMNPDPPRHKLTAEADVRQAIEDIGTNSGTKKDALSVLYSHAQNLDPTKGSSMLNDIFAAHDKNIAEIQRESRDIMEELIRDKDPFTGLFTNDERQILAHSEAYLMLDEEIKKAAEQGKPLTRRDTLIRATEIGRQMKRKIESEKDANKPPVFEPGLPETPVNTMIRPKNMVEFDAAIDALPTEGAKRKYFEKWYKDVPKD